VKIKPWPEAITDLELALDGGAHPDQANLHGMLAQAYENSGNPAMAAAHKAAATASTKPDAK
jgi:hypothetical protein